MGKGWGATPPRVPSWSHIGYVGVPFILFVFRAVYNRGFHTTLLLLIKGVNKSSQSSTHKNKTETIPWSPLSLPIHGGVNLRYLTTIYLTTIGNRVKDCSDYSLNTMSCYYILPVESNRSMDPLFGLSSPYKRPTPLPGANRGPQISFQQFYS